MSTPVGVWVQPTDGCTAACLRALPAYLKLKARQLFDEAWCPRCGSLWVYYDRAFIDDGD